MVCSKADGIAEIVNGKTGHRGIQINDTDSFQGVFVHQNVVQLGVVVGDPQGKLALPQRLHSYRTVLFVIQRKADLRLRCFGSAQLIRLQRRLELCKAVLGVVKIHDGLVECMGGIILQLQLKSAKGTGRCLKQFRRCLLQAQGVFHIGHQPPHLTGGVGVIVLAVFGFNQAQGLPRWISAPCLDLLAKMRCHTDKILHQLMGMGKRRLGQPLQNKADGLSAFGLANHTKGIVDMACAVTYCSE